MSAVADNVVPLSTTSTNLRAVKWAPRRILMVAACPFPAARGTPARILRMSETLAQRGHDVHVVTYHLGDVVEDLPFHVHRIRNVPSYRKTDPGPSLQKLILLDPLLAMKVSEIAKKTRPDVIHAHHFEGLLSSLPAHKRLSIPLVFDAHVLLDGELEYYKTGMPTTLRGKIARALDRRLPAMASHTVSVSDEIRDILIAQHGYDEQQVSVVANGVEDAFFHGNAKRFPKPRTRRLLFTGNLAAYQGTESMLRALSIIRGEREDTCLTVVTNSDPADFMRLARELGVDSLIEFVDCKVADLPDMIASADVAINPRTRCPGIPQKLLNYMAGAAPIVSFRGSAKYLRNGENALIIEDDDVDGFATAILRLLDNDALAFGLGRAAQIFARANLSWELNSKTVEKVYERLISARATNP